MRALSAGLCLALTLALLPAFSAGGVLAQDTACYVVKAENVRMWGWEMVPSSYNGVPCTLITAQRMEVTGMYQSGFELTASSMVWENVSIYAVYVGAWNGGISWTGDQVIKGMKDPLTGKVFTLKEVLGDPCTLPKVEMHALYLHGNNISIQGFLSKTFPSQMEVRADSSTLSSYDIVGTTYSGIKVTKIQAGSMKTSGVNMSAGIYRMSSPSIEMKNALLYTTYVKGRAIGLLPLEWSGSSVPWIVSISKSLLPTIVMTGVTMRTVYLQAEQVIMPEMTQSISG